MAKQRESWEPFWAAEQGAWVVDFRVDGERIRRRLPITEIGLKKVAIQFARRLYREAWEQALRKREGKEATSFREAAELYVKSGGEARFLGPIVKHFGPHTRVDAIDELTIARAAEVLYPHVKPDTVRRQLRVPIRAVQNFAAGRRRQRSTDSARMRWLSPEEGERLLLAASEPHFANLRDPELHTLRKIAFMLGTGAGPGETIAIGIDGWNPSTREWWLPGTKSVYRQRFVVLPGRTVDLIGNLPVEGRAFRAPNGHPYVLGDNRGGQMSEAFRKVREAAGLGTDVVPYTLRHTWATWFYAQTKDWGALLDQGGWNRADTANRYRKIAPADLGHRLLSHGWDFRRDPGAPVRFGELISLQRE